jgi:hypothetical protein
VTPQVLRGWQEVYPVSALRLLGSLPAECAGLVILDPPDHFHVDTGDGEDRTSIEEEIATLQPLAEEASRILQPGGATVILGRMGTAWELAAQWAGLRPVASLMVLWEGLQPYTPPTPIAWHLRPGLRRRGRTIALASSVLMAHPVPVEDRVNVSQRPVELFNFLITALTEPHDLVVDPFAGSGSALVAAEMCGRRWVGGDIEERQVEQARMRLGRMEEEQGRLEELRLWTPNGLIDVEG